VYLSTYVLLLVIRREKMKIEIQKWFSARTGNEGLIARVTMKGK
jgi:hypothetical protein